MGAEPTGPFQHLHISKHIDRPGRWPSRGASNPVVWWQYREC
jgi:hypothetical protein